MLRYNIRKMPFLMNYESMNMDRGEGGAPAPPELPNFFNYITWNTIFAPLHKRQKKKKKKKNPNTKPPPVEVSSYSMISHYSTKPWVPLGTN